MNKKTFSAFLAIMVLLAFSVQASAATEGIGFSRSLTFSGNTAVCNVTTSDYGKQIDVTMELWCGSTLLDTWTDSGTSLVTVSGSYIGVQSGKTYTLKAHGTSNGIPFTVTPISKTCP